MQSKEERIKWEKHDKSYNAIFYRNVTLRVLVEEYLSSCPGVHFRFGLLNKSHSLVTHINGLDSRSCRECFGVNHHFDCVLVLWLILIFRLAKRQKADFFRKNQTIHIAETEARV